MATYVLVHGAYHGAWCYSKVKPLLESAGHKALAVDLQGHGNNIVPIEKVTFSAYVHYLNKVIDDQEEKVLLVGHSLGGMSISQVAENKHGKIKKLVYLTALLPMDNESRMSISDRVNEDSTVAHARISTQDGLATQIDNKLLKTLFYHDCSQSDLSMAKNNLVPQASEPLTAKVCLTAEKYGSVPRVYIECLRDRAIPIKMQRKMVSDVPCEYVETLDTAHSPFFSAPEELAQLLISL